METIWVIGVGLFGSHAVRSLSRRHRDWRFVLVDPVEENLIQVDCPNCTRKKEDGISYLNHQLFPEKGPSWIIPALPVHLAGEWCRMQLGPDRVSNLELPDAIEPFLPNPMRGEDGNIYVSHADFKCPENCAEPEKICTVTREKRKRDMYEVLGDLAFSPFQSLVIRSRQLAPGVGGYRPEALFKLLERVESATGYLLLSTACRCHGVVTGLNRHELK